MIKINYEDGMTFRASLEEIKEMYGDEALMRFYSTMCGEDDDGFACGADDFEYCMRNAFYGYDFRDILLICSGVTLEAPYFLLENTFDCQLYSFWCLDDLEDMIVKILWHRYDVFTNEGKKEFECDANDWLEDENFANS